jgi:hypothetical protein
VKTKPHSDFTRLAETLLVLYPPLDPQRIAP